MPLIVLLNGPPGSGKDQGAKFIEQAGELRVSHKKFAGKLKRDIANMLEFRNERGDARTWNQMEASAENWKDNPQHITYGFTPREIAIWYSEEVIKPKFGKDFFGKALSREIKDSPAKMIVVSDSGFPEEAQVLIRDFGKDSILLVHLMRNGSTFEKDSRSFIELPGVTTVEINNRHDLFFYRVQIINAVWKWAGWELPEDIQ